MLWYRGKQQGSLNYYGDYGGSGGGYGRGGGGGGGSGWDGLLLLAAMVCVLLVWLVVKACWLVVKALRQEGEKKALWITLLLWFGALVGLVAVAGLSESGGGGSSSSSTAAAPLLGVALGIVGLFSLLLVLTARAVISEHQQVFSRPKEQLTTAVLKRPWWPPVQELN